MSAVALVYAVFASAEEAERIVRSVVGEKLAACANIFGPCTSVYVWDGALQCESEVPALFKTTPGMSDALVARIVALHSYDVPAVLVCAAGAYPPFAAWVGKGISV
jgi:periplasmic divalent cation tolerance protein